MLVVSCSFRSTLIGSHTHIVKLVHERATGDRRDGPAPRNTQNLIVYGKRQRSSYCILELAVFSSLRKTRPTNLCFTLFMAHIRRSLTALFVDLLLCSCHAFDLA